MTRIVIAIVAGATLATCRQTTPERHPDLAVYAASGCGGATRDWQSQGSEYGELMLRNKLDVDGHGLAWNGVPISSATLDEYLYQVHRMKPSPNLQMIVDPTASCEVVRRLRRVVVERLRCGDTQSCVEYSRGEWRKKQPPGVN